MTDSTSSEDELVEKVGAVIMEAFHTSQVGTWDAPAKAVLATARPIIAQQEREKVLRELLLPSQDMRRAWVAAYNPNDIDLDGSEPLHGTGQGDLTMVPQFENVFYVLRVCERNEALIKVFATEHGITLEEK